MEITGTAVGSSPLLEKPATFLLTLGDPCDPPNQIIKPNFDNQVYTITDANATPYVIPEFSVDPIFCPIDYYYDISYLVDSNNADTSAITQDTVNERKFSFFYD